MTRSLLLFRFVLIFIEIRDKNTDCYERKKKKRENRTTSSLLITKFAERRFIYVGKQISSKSY